MKTAKLAATIDLDKLAPSLDRAASLLKHREPGLMTWNEMLIKELTGILGQLAGEVA